MRMHVAGGGRLMLVGLVVASVLGLRGSSVLGQTDARGFLRVTPEQVKWVDEPNGFGVQRAAIQGDPTKPGIYVARIKFPPGVMSRPHIHKEDRHALVIKGTWYTGTGDVLAPDKTVPLKPGSYMLHPGGERHFDGAKDEEVILQLIGYGPSQTTYLDPKLSSFTRPGAK